MNLTLDVLMRGSMVSDCGWNGGSWLDGSGLWVERRGVAQWYRTVGGTAGRGSMVADWAWNEQAAQHVFIETSKRALPTGGVDMQPKGCI